MTILTEEQKAELVAIRETMCALKKPTFQHRGNWSWYKPLVDAGLIEMGDHPDFSDDFKAVSLTQAGWFAIAGLKEL